MSPLTTTILSSMPVSNNKFISLLYNIGSNFWDNPFQNINLANNQKSYALEAIVTQILKKSIIYSS